MQCLLENETFAAPTPPPPYHHHRTLFRNISIEFSQKFLFEKKEREREKKEKKGNKMPDSGVFVGT